MITQKDIQAFERSLLDMRKEIDNMLQRMANEREPHSTLSDQQLEAIRRKVHKKLNPKK